MCRAMEEMRNEAVKEERVEVARQLLELGKLSYEEIAKIAKMTTDEVKALDEKVLAQYIKLYDREILKIRFLGFFYGYSAILIFYI